MIVKINEMKNIKSIPTGYKQTDAGIIPDDWDAFPLGKVFDFKNGLNKGKEYFGAGTPIINYMDVYIAGGIYSSFVRGKVLVNNEEKKNYSARKGDVFFTRTSETVEEIGLSSVLLDEIQDAVFSGFVLRGRQKIDIFVDSFMKYCFRSEQLRKQIKNTASYTTRALTNGSMLAKVCAPVPNKTEQRAIAKVLSDTDTLITALNQLITKKKAIKTTTMQQLLTGRTRLPQFAKYPDGTIKNYKSSELGIIPEDWKITTIKDLTKNIIDYRGRTPKKLGMDWGGGNILALSAGNVKKGFIDLQSENHFGSHELYKKWMVAGDVQKGDIVFTMEAPLGNAALIPNDEKYILSQRTILLQVNREKYNPKLVIQIFLTNHFQEYIANSATGSTAQGIKRSIFEKLLVVLPACLQEQTAIATILSDMDTELIVLEKKLAKIRDIKKGMMQQLLTGRIRLPLEQQP